MRSIGGISGSLKGVPALVGLVKVADVANSAHALPLLDRAGWHIASDLEWPKNITPILLPSKSPELNPGENVWQFLRANFLSNRVFET